MRIAELADVDGSDWFAAQCVDRGKLLDIEVQLNGKHLKTSADGEPQPCCGAAAQSR
jgi:hypothetical protein